MDSAKEVATAAASVIMTDWWIKKARYLRISFGRGQRTFGGGGVFKICLTIYIKYNYVITPKVILIVITHLNFGRFRPPGTHTKIRTWWQQHGKGRGLFHTSKVKTGKLDVQ